MENELICILGPTATGKTQLAAHIAYELKGEVISADSRQVYRGMNIGTGKDLDDFIINETQIPYHLIDIAEPGYEYNVFEYQHDFHKVYHDITSRKRQAVLCGGTGLYIQSVLEGYRLHKVPPDPELRLKLEKYSDIQLENMLAELINLHNTTDTSSRKRMIRAIEIGLYYKKNKLQETNPFPPLKAKLFGLLYDRDTVKYRITERLKTRLKNGMVEEVQHLLQSGIQPEKLHYYGLEYRYLMLYLTGALSYQQMFEKLNIAIHQFSKRQMTWFRKMEREGYVIQWIDGILNMHEKVGIVMESLNQKV